MTSVLTLKEAADRLLCSQTTVKRRIRAGALPAFHDGRIVRVREADLERYVRERVRAARPDAVPAPLAGRKLTNGARLWD